METVKLTVFTLIVFALAGSLLLLWERNNKKK